MKSKFGVRYIIEFEEIVFCATLPGVQFELDEKLKKEYGQAVKHRILESWEIKKDERQAM